MILEVIDQIEPALLFFILLVIGSALFLITKNSNPKEQKSQPSQVQQSEIYSPEIHFHSNLSEEEILKETENLLKIHISKKYNLSQNFEISEIDKIEKLNDDGEIIQLADFITRCTYSGERKKLEDVKQIYEKLERIIKESQDLADIQKLDIIRKDIEIIESNSQKPIIKKIEQIKNKKIKPIKNKSEVKKKVKEVKDPRIRSIDDLERINEKLKNLRRPGLT